MKKCLVIIFFIGCGIISHIKANNIFQAFDEFQEADQEAQDEQTELKNTDGLQSISNSLKQMAYKQFQSGYNVTFKKHIIKKLNGEIIYEEKDGVVLVDKNKEQKRPQNQQRVVEKNVSSTGQKNRIENVSKQISNTSQNTYKKSSNVHSYKSIQSTREQTSFRQPQQPLKTDSKSAKDIQYEIDGLRQEQKKVQENYKLQRQKLAAVESKIEEFMNKMADNQRLIRQTTNEKRKKLLQNLNTSYQQELKDYKAQKKTIEDQKEELKNKHYSIDGKIKGLKKILDEAQKKSSTISKSSSKVNSKIQIDKEIKQKEIERQAELVAKEKEKLKRNQDIELKQKQEELRQQKEKLQKLMKEKQDQEKQQKELQRKKEQEDKIKREQQQKQEIQRKKEELEKEQQKLRSEFQKQKLLRQQQLKKAEEDRKLAQQNQKAILVDKESNIDKDNFRPIKIVYDQSFLEDSLKKIAQQKKIGKQNQSQQQIIQDYKQKVRTLLNHCDQIFKKYLWVQKDQEQKVDVPQNFEDCQARNNGSETAFNYPKESFTHPRRYNADLVIFFTAYHEEYSKAKNQEGQIVQIRNKVNASALPCKVERFLQSDQSYLKRTTVGRINFNLANMDLSTNDVYKYSQYVNTSVHELFHVIAFHEVIYKDFNKFVDRENFPHLYSLKLYNDKTEEYPMESGDAHWKEKIIPIDVMIPTSSRFKALSVYSLEYIDLANKLMVTDRSSMPENFYTKHLNFKENFLDFKCVDTESSKNPYFCSKLDNDNDPFGCSVDYKMKVGCSSFQTNNGRYQNNCYPKNPYSGQDDDQENSYCTNINGIVNDNNRAEKFGRNSRCFKLKPKYGSICLEFDIEGNDLYIKLADQKAKCENDHQFLDMKYYIPGKKGSYYPYSIKCPDIKNFINAFKRTNCSNECYFNGFCVEGKCECFAGWDPSENCRTQIPNSPGAFSSFAG